MNSKNNRQNHDFQIAYFLAGSCHTADGAYALLCDLHEDRETAIKSSEAGRLREQAKRLRAILMRASEDEAIRLEGQADLAEIEAFAAVTARNFAAAKAELTTIERCQELLQPLRKFAHLPLPQAHEAAQHDEWKLELIHRAENQLLATGCISPETLGTMRMHPAFKAELWPAVQGMSAMLQTSEGREKLAEKVGAARPFSLPLLDQAK